MNLDTRTDDLDSWDILFRSSERLQVGCLKKESNTMKGARELAA
jgi:hypothetical protein